MRFESRHRQLKANAQSTSCNINLLKTIATKQMLKMCHMVHAFKRSNSAQLGSSDSRDCSKKYPDEAEFYEEVIISEITYRLGTFLVTDMRGSEKEFGKIIKIVQIKHEIFFDVEVFKELTFDDHYHAYIVEEGGKEKLMQQKEIPNIAPCLSIKIKNTHFISARYGL